MPAPTVKPGAQLRAARTAASLSQRQAAERAGVTQATWSLYESGGRGMLPSDAAWAAVRSTEPAAPARPRGRPPMPRRRQTPEGGTYEQPTRAEGLLGMPPTELARWLYGAGVGPAEVRRTYRICAGDTDPGIPWLAELLARAPDVDAREVIADLAGRILYRRGQARR